MVLKAKLYNIFLIFSVFDPFFAPRPQMGSIARMDPKFDDTCPGYHPQPIGRNRVFKFERPGPALLIPSIHINFQYSR